MTDSIKQYQLQILLKNLRVKTKLNQSELAQKINKPQSYISKYECGEKLLYFTEVYEICKALNISFNEFAKIYENNLLSIKSTISAKE